jgi:hypothetical protein
MSIMKTTSHALVSLASGNVGRRLACILFILASTTVAAGQEAPIDFYQDFRGGKQVQRPFLLSGPEAKTAVKSEQEGLRITLPADRKDLKSVGLTLMMPVEGDFEIEADYELLSWSELKEGQSAGFEVWFRTETASDEAIAFSRQRRGPDPAMPLTDAFTWFRLTTDDKGGRRAFRHVHGANSKSGKLHIARRGATVRLAAREEGNSFRDLGRVELGAEKVKMIRFTANTDNHPVAIDLRLRELRVRNLPKDVATALEKQGVAPSSPAGKAGPLAQSSEKIGPAVVGDTDAARAAVGAKPVSSETAEQKDSSTGNEGSLTANLEFISAAATLMLMLAVGCWLFVRRKRRLTSAREKQEKSTAAPIRRIACRACGRQLRVKAAVAGKKLRCPCGQPVLIPWGGDRANQA